METTARTKIKKLWQPGDLFHNVSRYPRKRGARRVDRLAGILQRGILAPAACEDGSVCSDLSITATGLEVPYDTLVFLHRFGPRSGLYTFSEPGRFTVLIDQATPVLTPEQMWPHWVVLSQDEVYVRELVELEQLIGVVVHAADVDAVLRDFLLDFDRLEIPLYLYDGTVVWPQ